MLTWLSRQKHGVFSFLRVHPNFTKNYKHEMSNMTYSKVAIAYIVYQLIVTLGQKSMPSKRAFT